MREASFREFSASVSIELEVNGTSIPVAQLSDEFIITRHPFDVPPTAGVIVLKVDRRVDRFKVYLPDGIDPSRVEQRILSESIAVQ